MIHALTCFAIGVLAAYGFALALNVGWGVLAWFARTFLDVAE